MLCICRAERATTRPRRRRNKSTLQFPVDNPELLAKWKVFANIENPTPNSSLCEQHFEEHYLKWGKITTLDWRNNPVPTKQVGDPTKKRAPSPENQTQSKFAKIKINNPCIPFEISILTDDHPAAGHFLGMFSGLHL